MQQKSFGRFVLATGFLAVLLTVIGPPGNAEGPRPGLPSPPEAGASWTKVVQGGAAEAAKAKQWTRVPMQVSTAATIVDRVDLPGDDPRTSRTRSVNYIYLMAETGAPHNYGLTAPFTAHTVAFGAVPVTATLRMEQRRDAAGLPLPIVVTVFDDFYRSRPPEWPTWALGRVYEDSRVSDTLEIWIESVTVDGVDLRLRPGCRTGSRAQLRLHGKGFLQGDPNVDELEPWHTGHYVAAQGGLLTGTIDIPAFTDCLTNSGEDVSALLTSAISSPGNAVSLHVNSPFTTCTATNLPQVGEYDAATICPQAIPGRLSLPPQH